VARWLVSLDGDFDSRETDRKFLWNFFSVGQAILDVQADGVFDILDRFFVGISLAIATLGTGNKIAVGIGFNDDWKYQIPHTCIIGAPSYCTDWFFGNESAAAT
jgi:hypothetical protein